MSNEHPHHHHPIPSNSEAHQKDHKVWSRRNFLTSLGVSGGMGMLFNKIPLKAFATSPLNYMLSQSDSNRILVLIRLKGGNDGLNTIIPVFDYGTYINKRPNIGIQQSNLIMLDDAYGIPNYMSEMNSMWQSGNMKVVHSVGYPEQNLSHFRSADIWASASDSEQVDETGWLGRFLGNEYPNYLLAPPSIPPAIQIGSTGNLAFNAILGEERTNMAVSVSNPEELYEIAQNGELYDVNNVPECFYGEQLGFIRSVANSTFVFAETIKNAYDVGTNSVEYQNNPFANQMALVARLIKGNLGTQLYMVTLDGFDTHANQANDHAVLMNYLSNGINTFYNDLADGDWDKQVLSMTFSEFGRRIEQNASEGTDHGAAAPVMMFGGDLEGGGFVGTGPQLSDPDENGNLQFHTDFRQIYSTVLSDWLCIEENLVNQIMGQSFDKIEGLVRACESDPVGFNNATIDVQHKAVYLANGNIRIDFNLPTQESLQIDLFGLNGQKIKTLYKGSQNAGPQSLEVPFSQMQLPKSIYIYSIKTSSAQYSGKLKIMLNS